MLQLKDIKKDYYVADTTVHALQGINLSFRRNEFVSVLGASGCGKTTLLNIIGGLDHYTSGDLIIDGTSTKDYKDGDWDTYRNHRIGFVFQTYNLIPHQTVLGNVELALTLSGVSKKERRQRAEEALKRVGLGNEINKKPNQLSGGQMQRVAIARALVNEPEILLADEPTGALDTKTSVQIMDLIKEIAGERLVIMVTHNPELARDYSTRIVELKDGCVISDSNPYSPEEEEAECAEHKQSNAAAEESLQQEQPEPAQKGVLRKKKHSSMSYLTAFALSGKNLLTKKARTLITSIAGSIGIISVCLVLALSSGFNSYIKQTEEDMLSYYPVEISETALDLTSLMSGFMGGGSGLDLDEIDDKVYVNSFLTQLALGLTTSNDINQGNFNANGYNFGYDSYLEYLEAMPDEYYNAIHYEYGVTLTANLFTSINIGSESTSTIYSFPQNEDGSYGFDQVMSLASIKSYYSNTLAKFSTIYGQLASFVSYLGDVVSVMPGTASTNLENGTFGDYVLSQYDVLAGEIYTSGSDVANQAVLVVGSDNDVTDLTLAQLGLISQEDFLAMFLDADSGESLDYDYDEILGKEYTLYFNDAIYTDNTDNASGSGYAYDYVSSDKYYSYDIDTTSGTVSAAHHDFLSQGWKDDNSLEADSAEGVELEITAIVKLKDGLSYGCLTSGLNLTEKLIEEYIDANKGSGIVNYINNNVDKYLTAGYPVSSVASSDGYFSDGYTSYYSAVRALGGNNEPESIQIYAIDFDSKNDMLDYIDGWNDIVEEQKAVWINTYGSLDNANADGLTYSEVGPTEITYSDTVGTLMGMVDTILNAVTYVLVAFTAISLVVSTVMIGVITYVSVVERTKEIGVLRSIGARKKDIRHVFNAESFIIGLAAGLIGIIVAYLFQLLINVILVALTGISGLAALPFWQAIIMVVVSVVLTLISGLIPASAAAKKDPVVCLRSE
ncbi:MAG: ABC transporter ATP-binding protein/permease [Clostridia bacterium]|nr:ABC transporter ATP-binding protein/permease [Clostridia bacterium]